MIILKPKSRITHDKVPTSEADPDHPMFLPLSIDQYQVTPIGGKDSHSTMAASNSPAPSPAFIPNPTYLFSATVHLGKPLVPIPMVEGGLRIVEPITGGTIQGPGFNATIEGGVAAPIVFNNGDGTRTQMPYAYVYGHASDGSPFYLEKSGIGSGVTQTARVVINVGGEYQGLQTMYVLGQPSVNEERTIASVDCFSVPLPPSKSGN